MRFTPSPPKRPATAAVYLTLAAQLAAMTALVLFEEVRGRRLAAEIASLGGDPRSPGAEALVGAVTLFAVLMMLLVGTTVAASAAYLTWLVRVRQANSRTATAAPVAAGWLIPGVNLIAPALLVDEVWRGAQPPLDRRHRWLALLGAWWLSWLTALSLVVVRLPLDAGAGELTGLSGVELAATTVAALLCALTVREITRIQTAPSRQRFHSLRPPPRSLSAFRRTPLEPSGTAEG
ncbi:DUF4328 domain-containing protein [Nonomuraea sp. NPDC046570]|uniref:DUF4328 domain-containing protein n=1 Tax=Nonomuraea sp. NPDC046570 TaxID=3155255 RepID=UPI0033F7ECC8